MKHASSFFALLLAAAAAKAHGTVCLANNDATAAVSGALTQSLSSGARVHAWQLFVGRTVFPQAAFLFTASPVRDDYMQLEIWTDSNGAPGVRILHGAMASPQSSAAGWLGANFENTGLLSRNVPYWFVWVEPGDSIVPEEPGGNPIPYVTLGPNGWSSVQQSPVKLRLFCGDTIDSVEVLRQGFSCGTSFNTQPSAWSNEHPNVGNAGFRIEGVHLPPGENAWMLVGFDPNFIGLALDQLLGAPLFCFLHTEVRAVRSLLVGTAGIGSAPATARPTPSGHVLFPLPIPGDPTLAGTVALVQIVAVDPGANVTLPIVTTNALRITIQ